MSKKNQKEGKKVNNLHKYFNKNNQTEDKNIQQSILKNQCRKRACPILNDSSSRDEKSSSAPLISKKNNIFSIAKAYDADQLLFQCPKLADLAMYLEVTANLHKKIVKNIIKKCIQSNSHSLWSSKYAPNDCSELFNVKAGHKIKDWLNAFFEYKNKICEESDSFLNDFQEEKSCKIYKNIRENQWQLLALVVRGRPGTGKSSAVRAIAHEMEIDLQQCGNEYNQTKYLKEKNQSTQSESVKTAISRKVKLEKNAQMITKFMSPVEREKAAQTKKSQMIHNVGEIFPLNEAHKFYNELNRCIQLSKIPFIMTDSCDKLPRQCEKYDVIEFQHGSSERIQQILWVIYHVESILRLDTLKEIDKESLFDEITNQISGSIFRQIISLPKIHQICSLFNYRLDYIFTYLQHNQNLESNNLRPLFLQKYKQYTKEKLLDQIQFIDFQKFHIEEKTSIDKKQEHDCSTQDCEQHPKVKNGLFYDHLRRLRIARAEDTIISKQEGSLSESCLQTNQWQKDSYICIRSCIHKSVKRGLLQKVNLQINSISDKFKSTLRVSELQYLPMLIKEKRSSRNSKASDDIYHKFFTENECVYIKQFGHLIKNE